MNYLMRLLLIGSVCFIGTLHAALVQEGEQVPNTWGGNHWLIMPLALEDNEAYYKAHQASAPYLYEVLGWGWPTKKISIEVNLDMVRHHVKQHEQKSAFTYVLREKEQQAIAGAVYITPVNTERRHIPNFNANDFTAEVSFWFTQDAEQSEYIGSLITEILTWVEKEWQLKNVLVPVNEKYTFIHREMEKLELIPFTEDSETGEQLYRLP